MDVYSWYIANLHQMLGHDKAAQVIGVPPGDKDACLICAYEREPTDEHRQRMLDALP